jgi:transposase
MNKNFAFGHNKNSGGKEMENAKNELKEQILAMIAAGRDPKELSKEYGLHSTTIANWRKGSKDPKVKPKLSAEQLELKALKAENLQLKMERDVLKKAMAIMSVS